MTSSVQAIIMQVLTHLPSMLLGMIGVALAIARIKDYPRVATFALIGFGLSVLAGVVYPLLNIWIVHAHGARAQSEIAWVVSLVSGLGIVLSFGIQGCLLAAVFLDRPRRTPEAAAPAPPPLR